MTQTQRQMANYNATREQPLSMRDRLLAMRNSPWGGRLVLLARIE